MIYFLANLPYLIIAAPLVVGMLWFVGTAIFSPVIVTHNIIEAFESSQNTFSKPSNTFEKPSNISEKLSYDSKYAIEDLFGFGDESVKLKVGDVVFEDDKIYHVSKK